MSIPEFFKVCKQNHLSKIKELLESESPTNINFQDVNRRTALMIACRNGQLPLVDLLLTSNKVELNLRDEDGRTALFCACERGKIDIVKRLLCEWGIHVNTPKFDGTNPLMISVSWNLYVIVELLLEDERIGPSLNGVDSMRKNIFHWACAKGNLEMIKLLMGLKEIDVNAQTNTLLTPFMIACRQSHLECITYLLRINEIKVNSQDRDGKTALFYAAATGNARVLNILLHHQSVNPNLPDAEGWTPLSIACSSGHLLCVQHLLASEKSINLDSELKNPFKYAKNEKISKLLAKYQQDPIRVRRKLQRKLNHDGFILFIFIYSQFISNLIIIVIEMKAATIFSLMVLISDDYLVPC